MHGLRRFRGPDIIAILFCLAALAFLLCGIWVRPGRVAPTVAPLAAVDPRTPLLSGAGFAKDAVYFSVARPAVHGNLQLFGSWTGTDKSVGSVRTRWYRAVRRFSVLIAGYPSHPGCQLFLELEAPGSNITRLPLVIEEAPGESWSRKEILLSASAADARFRIVAEDNAIDAQGWLGFSEPFVITGTGVSEDAKELVLVILACANGLVMVLAPGLLIRARRAYTRRLRDRFFWVPIPGILILSVTGIVAWKGPALVSPVVVCRAVLFPLATYFTYRFLRAPISSITTAMQRRILAVVIVLCALAMGKATYSVGPPGELYANKISRTLEIGSRSDSRISYHLVQIVAARTGAYSPLAKSLLAPWSFSDRGPLTGLAASPLVLAGPVKVTDRIPDQPWTVLDPEGFSAYRIAMIVFASCGLIAVFGLARYFLSSSWAFLALLVAASAPFVVHETYFTWPKMLCASFVLWAACALLSRRFVAGGLLLGLGYLCHPSALMSLPALAALVVLRGRYKRLTSAGKLVHIGRAWLLMLVGLAFWLVVWRLVNLQHFAQTGFLDYFFDAGGVHAQSVGMWWRARLDSLLNTLVPFFLFAVNRTNKEMNALGGHSPWVVEFFQQYWDALPFAAGIVFFFALLRVLYAALRNALQWLVWVFIVPLLFFTIYWGGATTGMMREGLHAWFLGLMIFAVVIWRKFLPDSRAFWRFCSFALLFRGVEIICLLLAPAIATRHAILQRQFALSDAISLAAMLAATAWVCKSALTDSEALRRTYERGQAASHAQRHSLGTPTASHSPQWTP